MDQAKRLKELEKENGKLKRLVAELALAGRDPGAEVCPHIHPRSPDSRCRIWKSITNSSAATPAKMSKKTLSLSVSSAMH